MLKHYMLSGWLRVQPFQKYLAFVVLIAPLAAVSAYSTSAKQSQAVKIKPSTQESHFVPQETVAVGVNLAEVPKASNSAEEVTKLLPVPMSISVVREPQLSEMEMPALIVEDNSLHEDSEPEKDPLVAVEFAPIDVQQELVGEDVESKLDLVQRLKASKIQSLAATNEESASRQLVASEVLEVVTVAPSTNKLRPATAIPVVSQPPEDAQLQQDPIGSPHPIPWNWIQATQEAIGSKGNSGVRYYRSVPIVSPDGRYAAYSRVQIEVKPEMHNSHVSSILFIEDRQTKKLQVISSTSTINDPLLKVNLVSSDSDTQGTIGVLVPVSWSSKGDRFLARKFEGYLNTSDVTDKAVIWDRANYKSHSVTPSQEQHDHEIAVLLGWSQAQPDRVLFRAGELGDEQWPMVTVAYDGTTVAATNADQPVTFGEQIKQVWAGPPVAYR